MSPKTPKPQNPKTPSSRGCVGVIGLHNLYFTAIHFYQPGVVPLIDHVVPHSNSSFAEAPQYQVSKPTESEDHLGSHF